MTSSEISESRVFVEIGCSFSPVVLRGNTEFPEPSQYIGIDIRERDLRDAHSLVSKEHPDVNMELIHWTAEALPLVSDSVDEVFLGNVLGDPSIDRKRLTRLRQQRSAAWIESEIGRSPEPISVNDCVTLPRILKQAHRVLRDDGQLSILETLTPLSLNVLIDLLRLSGFALRHFVTCNNPSWHEVVDPYDIKPNDGMPYSPAYIAFAKKRLPC